MNETYIYFELVRGHRQTNKQRHILWACRRYFTSSSVCLFVWWCLTSLSTKVQLYRGGQFKCWRTQRKPVVSHWQTLSYNVVHFALIEIRTCNISGDRHWIKRFRKFRIQNIINLHLYKVISLSTGTHSIKCPPHFFFYILSHNNIYRHCTFRRITR